MGIFSGLHELIFGKQKQADTVRFEMISQGDAGFYAFGTDIYQSDVVRAAIRPFAKGAGKMLAKHILSNETTFKENPRATIRFLLEEPNPLMCGQVLQEKVAIQYKLNNNAFIYIKRNDFGTPVELWPIPAQAVEAQQNNEGFVFLKFTFMNGKNQTIDYRDIIHLRNDFNSNDLFGESPRNILMPLLEIVTSADKSVVQAVRNSAVINWIVKINQNLKADDIKKKVDDFTETYLDVSSNRNVIGVGSNTELERVDNKNYIPEDGKSKVAIQRLNSYFGSNENIITSAYTEDEWIAYYEAELEPYAIQISNEFSRKIFSRRERAQGNSIIFESSNLQHASMTTKLNLRELVDRGAMKVNEWRKVMNLGPVEGGDILIRRLDTAAINNETSVDGEGGDE